MPSAACSCFAHARGKDGETRKLAFAQTRLPCKAPDNANDQALVVGGCPPMRLFDLVAMVRNDLATYVLERAASDAAVTLAHQMQYALVSVLCSRFLQSEFLRSDVLRSSPSD
jgi:hypothetical protein